MAHGARRHCPTSCAASVQVCRSGPAARFYGNNLWVVAHTSPVYYAVGILQYAVHGLQVTPESITVNFAALISWALVAAGAAWLGLRRAVVA